MIVSKKTLSVPPAIILERGGVVSCLLLSGIFLICCCCGYPLFIFSRITGWALKTPANKVDIFMEASLLNKRWIAGLCNSSWPEPGKRRGGGKEGREEQMDGEQTDGRTYGLIDGRMDGWMDDFYGCVFSCHGCPPRKPSILPCSVWLPCISQTFSSIRLSVLLTLSLYLFLFLSPSPTFLCLPRPLSSRLSPTFSSHSLIYYSHPLADSFFLSHDTWNPSVRCRAFRPPTKSASLSGKGTRWWIKEQSKETDKKLRDGRLYRYVSYRASSLYRLTFNTLLLCNPSRRPVPAM